jgi:integrase
MKQYIEKYLEDRKLAWSESTLRSERHRLNAVADALDGEPRTLWNAVKGLAPYSRLTTWTRVVNFWDYLIEQGVVSGNPYKVFKSKNAKQFKNVYERETPEESFEEILRKVDSIEADDVRAEARLLLLTGLRASEPGSLTRNGEVHGKGGKRRRVYAPDDYTPSRARPSYQRLLRGLRGVGLRPHTLRKVFATELVRRGANPFELMEAMGWSCIATATSYVNPNQQSLAEKVRLLQKEK